MALEKFSKHQKVILITIAAALALPLGVAGILQSVMARRRSTVASLFGEDVSELDMHTFVEHWRAIARANPPAARQMGFDRPGFYEDYFVLTQVARRSGIHVSDEEVATQAVALLQLPPGVDDATYARNILSRTEATPAVFEQAVRELIMCRSLHLLYVQSLKATHAEIQDFYDENYSQIKLQVAEIPADRFKEDVSEPSEDDIRERYELEKEAAWLEVPRRLQVEYLSAPYETWVPLVTVEEMELDIYYDRRKEDYRIEEPPASQPASAPTSAEEAVPAPEGPPEEAGDTPEVAVSPDGGEVEAPDSQAAARYRPFDEVKGEIERIIRERRAREAAAALVMKARLEAQELGMEEAGKLNGLIPGKTEFFSEDTAADVPVIGSAPRVTDDDSMWEVASRLEPGQISLTRNDTGEYVIRLVEDQPARPPTLDEAKAELRERILDERMLDAAVAAVGKARQAGSEGTELDQAVSLIGKEIETSTTDFLSTFSFEPYVAEAFGADVGTVSVTIDRSASPPVVYLWKMLERKLPEEGEFESFMKYFGSIGVISSRYGDLEERFFEDVKKHARWKDLRPELDRNADGEGEDEQS